MPSCCMEVVHHENSTVQVVCLINIIDQNISLVIFHKFIALILLAMP